MSNNKIDKHIKKLVEQLSFFNMYFSCFVDWYNNDWIINLNKKIEEHKNCKYFKYIEAKLTLNNRDYFIRKLNYESKIYEYFVYVREFLNTLRVFLSKKHRDYKKHKKMWESSQYLKYYVHLIFKTGFYKKKIFNTDEEILEEIKRLNSFLSKPLHANSIYYETKYDNKTINDIINKETKEIINILLNYRFFDEVINYPIDPNIKGSEQEYLNHTINIAEDENNFKNNLNFWKDKCLEEFDNILNLSNETNK